MNFSYLQTFFKQKHFIMQNQNFKFSKLFILLALSIPVLFIACDDDDDNVDVSNAAYIAAASCNATGPTYLTDIAPIFNASCATAGCHNNDEAAKGLTMEGYDNAKAGFTSYNILCSINQDDGCASMPIGGSKLSAADILAITCWAKGNFPE